MSRYSWLSLICMYTACWRSDDIARHNVHALFRGFFNACGLILHMFMDNCLSICIRLNIAQSSVLTNGKTKSESRKYRRRNSNVVASLRRRGPAFPLAQRLRLWLTLRHCLLTSAVGVVSLWPIEGYIYRTHNFSLWCANEPRVIRLIMCICSARFDATGARRETVATPRHRGWFLRTRGPFLAGGDFSSNLTTRSECSCQRETQSRRARRSRDTLSKQCGVFDSCVDPFLTVICTDLTSILRRLRSPRDRPTPPDIRLLSLQGQQRGFIQNFPFLTHWRMAGNGVPVLLVTANVGSIFEEVSFPDFFAFSFLAFLSAVTPTLNDRSIVPRDLPSNAARPACLLPSSSSLSFSSLFFFACSKLAASRVFRTTLR